MYQRILLAYDGSIEGRVALREGAMLAQLCKAEVMLLAVVDLSVGIILAEGAAPGSVDHQRERYEDVLAEGVERLKEAGFSPEARLEFGNPAHEIAAAAARHDADLVVVGHRHQSAFARWWGGSVGTNLLENLRCSLLIAQRDIGEG